MPYRFTVYDSKSIGKVRQFAQSDCVEILVMTIDSFNKDDNVIRQSTDRLQGATPLYLVQAARPVLILDEPQNMESEGRIKALASLHPLFALRYSATHRNPYNLVYRLTPFEAYRQGLVKRIEVASVVKEDDYNQVFLRLDEIRSAKKTIQAKIALHQRMANGTIKEKALPVQARRLPAGQGRPAGIRHRSSSTKSTPASRSSASRTASRSASARRRGRTRPRCSASRSATPSKSISASRRS